jgi:hypothetical protein
MNYENGHIEVIFKHRIDIIDSAKFELAINYLELLILMRLFHRRR